jgi:hypothetical protein
MVHSIVESPMKRRDRRLSNNYTSTGPIVTKKPDRWAAKGTLTITKLVAAHLSGLGADPAHN